MKKQNCNNINYTAILEDLLFNEILTRLPVKALLRFKSVSKYWNSLISSRQFTQLHLQHQPLPSVFPNLFYQTEGLPFNAKSKLFILKPERLNDDLSNNEVLPAFDYYNVDKQSSDFLGSCNGLICSQSMNFYMLSNPSTRKYYHLPGTPDNSYRTLHSGFGYDSQCDDYKIIVLGETLYGTNKPIAYSFSMRANKWKKLETDFLAEHPTLIFHESSHGKVLPVQMGLTMNWLICPSSPSSKGVVLVFDLSKDAFYFRYLPDMYEFDSESETRASSQLFLIEFRKSLCVCWITNNTPTSIDRESSDGNISSSESSDGGSSDNNISNSKSSDGDISDSDDSDYNVSDSESSEGDSSSDSARRGADISDNASSDDSNRKGFVLKGWKLNEFGIWETLNNVLFLIDSCPYLDVRECSFIEQRRNDESLIAILDDDRLGSCFCFSPSQGHYRHKASAKLPRGYTLKCAFSYIESLVSPRFGVEAIYGKKQKIGLTYI